MSPAPQYTGVPTLVNEELSDAWETLGYERQIVGNNPTPSVAPLDHVYVELISPESFWDDRMLVRYSYTYDEIRHMHVTEYRHEVTVVRHMQPTGVRLYVTRFGGKPIHVAPFERVCSLDPGDTMTIHLKSYGLLGMFISDARMSALLSQISCDRPATSYDFFEHEADEPSDSPSAG